MSEQLSQWVHRAAGKRVLLIGDLILDRYIYGDAERISPEAPVPVLRTVEKREAVGGAANVASCLRALGCEVACCGLVGTDRHATQLIGLLEELGADCSAVVSDADRPTTTKTRLVGLAQHRHRQQLLRVDDEDASPINPTESKSLIDAACAKLSACDVVCIEDYDKGVITSEVGSKHGGRGAPRRQEGVGGSSQTSGFQTLLRRRHPDAQPARAFHRMLRHV